MRLAGLLERMQALLISKPLDRHDLVSLSTQSDEFFWRAVYHTFSRFHQSQ